MKYRIFAIVKLEKSHPGACIRVGHPLPARQRIAHTHFRCQTQHRILEDLSQPRPIYLPLKSIEIQLKPEVRIHVRTQAKTPTILHTPTLVESVAAELQIRPERVAIFSIEQNSTRARQH